MIPGTLNFMSLTSDPVTFSFVRVPRRQGPLKWGITALTLAQHHLFCPRGDYAECSDGGSTDPAALAGTLSRGLMPSRNCIYQQSSSRDRAASHPRFGENHDVEY